jgi:hypothetical protein
MRELLSGNVENLLRDEATYISIVDLGVHLANVEACIAEGDPTLGKCLQCVTRNGHTTMCPFSLLVLPSGITNKE